MNKKNNTFHNQDENNFKIDAAIPQQVIDVFTLESKNRLQTLDQVLEKETLEEQKREVFVIAHGYKGYAGYLGLHTLEIASRQICTAINNNVNIEGLTPLVKNMVQILKKCLQINK